MSNAKGGSSVQILQNLAKSLSKRLDSDLNPEYQKLKEDTAPKDFEKSFKTSLKNCELNRYSNVHCLEKSRVKSKRFCKIIYN